MYNAIVKNKKESETNKMKNIANLLNLLTITEVTSSEIIVHDDDAGEDYDITELIKAAKAEFDELMK